MISVVIPAASADRDEARLDEVDVRVDAAGRRDEALPVDRRGVRADEEIGVVDHVGVPGPADADDDPVLHADVRLEHAQHGIHHDHVRDEQVQLARGRQLGAHHDAGANGLRPAAQHLVPVARLVPLDPRQEIGVPEPDPVAGRGAVARGVLRAAELTGHGSSGAPASRWP